MREVGLTRNGRIRACLLEGPATSAEIAASLGITRRSARVGLWVLTTQGHIRRTEGRIIADAPRSRRLIVWELTPRGVACQAKGGQTWIPKS